MYLHTCAHVVLCVCVEVREQLSGSSSLLPCGKAVRSGSPWICDSPVSISQEAGMTALGQQDQLTVYLGIILKINRRITALFIF